MTIKSLLSGSANPYFFIAFCSVLLYAKGIDYGQTSLYLYKVGWIERTVEYQNLEWITDRHERSKSWEYLRAKDNLATDQLWGAFGNFVLMAVSSIMLFIFGGANWLIHQAREDEIRCLERDRLQCEVDRMRLVRRSAWQWLTCFWKKNQGW